MQFVRQGIVIPTAENSWKSQYTANADLIRMNDTYYMYYRGTDQYHDRIGVLTCPLGCFDGIHFDRMDTPFVIDVGTPGTFDAQNILDPSAVVVDGKVYLYYSAISEEWKHSIGLAISEDGIHFSKQNSPVLEGRCPEIVYDGKKFWLYYVIEQPSHGYEIFCAVSENGKNFKQVGTTPVLTIGETGSWESFSVTTPRIFKEDDVYYMVYAGDDSELDAPLCFGVAASRDLVHWQKFSGNPIFRISDDPKAWDNTNIWFGTTEKIGDTYYMWYEGCNQYREHGLPDFLSVVGLATMKAPYFFIKPEDVK